MTQYAFIGAGNMPKSIISGMLKANIVTSINFLAKNLQVEVGMPTP